MMCGTARLVAGSLQNLCCHRLVLFLAFAKEHFAATLVEDQRRGLHGDCSISRGLRPVFFTLTSNSPPWARQSAISCWQVQSTLVSRVLALALASPRVGCLPAGREEWHAHCQDELACFAGSHGPLKIEATGRESHVSLTPDIFCSWLLSRRCSSLRRVDQI